VGAQHALVEQHQAEELFLLRLGEQRRLADEIAWAVEIDGPGEAGVER